MNTVPSFEARLSSLERRQVLQDARIEEVTQYTNTSIRQLSDEVNVRFDEVNVRFDDMNSRFKQLADDMDASFKQLADYQVKTEYQIDARFNLVETRLDKLEARFDRMEARFDKMETRFDTLETLLTQVLVRLPANPQ